MTGLIRTAAVAHNPLNDRNHHEAGIIGVGSAGRTRPHCGHSAGAMGAGFFQFVVAIIISGFVLANAEISKDFSVRLMTRLVGDNGPAYADVSGKIVSGVTQGILGVSLLQSALHWLDW